jgi:hypothetical protein
MDDLFNRLAADMDHFLVFFGTILEHWDLFFGPLGTSWWLRGRQEHESGQLGLQGRLFYNFLSILGTCWEACFMSRLVFFLVWGYQFCVSVLM